MLGLTEDSSFLVSASSKHNTLPSYSKAFTIYSTNNYTYNDDIQSLELNGMRTT
jgi:hypothetical protein